MVRVYTVPSPKQQYPENSCLRKKKIPDVEIAKRVAKRTHKRLKKKMCVYNCFYCGFWHIGTDRTETFKRLAKLKKRSD